MNSIDPIALVAEAALAPSVHNVQPARWRFGGSTVDLWEDLARRLPAGDPERRDAELSLGAAVEGMALALSARDLALEETGEVLAERMGDLIARRRFRIVPGARDPLQPHVRARQSHRGGFEPVTGRDREAALTLAGEDCTVVVDPQRIGSIAQQVDRSGHRFFRDPAFRAELRSWMRLRRDDPRWSRDGLNAEAMAMTRVEALGAGLVLGPLFRPLDAVGLAAPLTAEAAVIRGSAGILLFHRAADEPRFDSGRAFYRAWLRLEAAGLRGAVMAALADDREGAARVAELVPAGRTLVSALRIGRAPAGSGYRRARIKPRELLV
ncbi:hypothetical protein ABS767_11995 [Sphingomonas sp. ST-64]|uniref:BioF2-like acetyltransferase domain-containing protein n=1 Tax=Sphingomonas plantiphila TaxID=3163295 RepID=A0ABW8YQF2_9SPHN